MPRERPALERDLSEREGKTRVLELQKQARAQLEALGKRPRLRVLLTGATGRPVSSYGWAGRLYQSQQ